MNISKTIFLLTWMCATFSAFSQPERLFAERLLYVDEPIQVISWSQDPNDDRLLIPCHDGKIWIYDDGELLVPPFLDIGEDGIGILDYGGNSEQGINGMVLDPDFDENGLYYLTYTGTDPDGNGDPIEQRLMCFQRDPDNPLQTDYDTWYEILEFDEGDEPQWGHNAGQMHFGPDGHLYVSVGDGGSTGNGDTGGGSGGDDHGEFGNGQNLETLLGKILRIDVHGMAPYTIPDDNPFVGDPDAFDEIWSYGWRNPWRFSFDSETGDMFVGDVGEVDWEEISYEPAGSPGGLNFGWRLMEGNHCYEPVVDCDDGTLEYPIFEYPHDNGWCAIIGGFMYRGGAIPTLYGHYILGDGCGFESVKFWLLWEEDGIWQNSPVEVVVPGGIPTFGETRFGFGEDKQGELYMCTKLAVYKFMQDLDDITTVVKFEEPKVFPNPAHSSATLDIGEGNSIDKLELWDASGRKVSEEILEGVFGSMSLNLQRFEAGTYTLKVWCNDSQESRTIKLVISSTPE